MKQVVKLLAAATAGYFIGYYEFKYRFVKAVANQYINTELENDDTEEES